MNIAFISRFLTLCALPSIALAAGPQTSPAQYPEETFKIESNLRAGLAKIDVTPPPETKVAGHVRETKGARDPIRAAVLLLDDGRTRAAIVTFDYLCAWDELVQEARSAVSNATKTPTANILVATSHNHSG